MLRTCVDTALEELSWLQICGYWNPHLRDQIKNLRLELRFLRMFHWCFAMLEEKDMDMILRSTVADIEVELKEACQDLYFAGFRAIRKGKFKNWNLVTSKLLEKVSQIKPDIEGICLNLLVSSLQCKSLKSPEEFLDIILMNLTDLVSSKAELSDQVKKQIEALGEKLRLFRKLVDFTTKRCVSLDEIRDFRIHVQTWANRAAWLLLSYWMNGTEKTMAAKMDHMLFDQIQKIKPRTPEVTRMYFGVLKASKSSRSDTLLVGQILGNFVDFLLENIGVLAKDLTKILREGLIFLIAFLMDSPEEVVEDGKLIEIQKQIGVALNEAINLICLLCNSDEMEVGITEDTELVLRSFIEKFEIIKAEARGFCVSRFPASNFPRNNGLGFIDFLLGNLENLKEKLECDSNFLPFAKYQIFVIQEEILHLKPFFKDILELKHKDVELKALQMEIINMAYQVDRVINSCLIGDDPIWYSLIHLSHVIEQMNLVKAKVNERKGKEVQEIEVHSSDMISNHFLPLQSQTQDSGKDEVVVGLKEDAEAIVNLLTGGSSELGIVSIVGMPGLGKTTLAKKVYNDLSVRQHFIRKAFCCVSQTYETRNLLLDIVGNLTVVDAKILDMDEKELAECLYKCLKGQRYLIVLDDVWDIIAWTEIKISFPDDNNGSRVVFTTRIRKVAVQGKSSSIFPLRLLSDEESWELLQNKIFHRDGCPESFTVVGNQIAKNCKGLPLAVVVIAGLLARTPRSLKWWNEISDTTDTYLSSEGCMEILELSYTHLPEHLKSCFLYFGAFIEDKEISVRKLASLWIAEGIVQKSRMKSSKDMAKECLSDLIDRSLVIAGNHSSDGGIKTCRVHDLLRDLCSTKAKEENFLKQVHGDDVFGNSTRSLWYDQYRFSVQTEWSNFVHSVSRCPSVHTLLYSSSSDSTGNRHPTVRSFFRSFKLLQVLDLEEVDSESFPKDITLLVLLRYLAVKGYILSVPSSIESLRNLETLVVRKKPGWPIRLPSSIWNMKRLRHVDVGRNAIIRPFSCELEVYTGLDNVESFSSPTFSYGTDGEELLRRIPNVRKFSCQFLDSWDSSNNCNRLPELDLLSRLESLNVIYRGKALQPYAFKLPSTLKKLTLSNFCFPWSEMSMIVKLPNLEVLKLLSNAFVGENWNLEDEEFLKLKFLKLQNIEVEQWNAHADSFPYLERLLVIDCTKLEEIPSSFGEIYTLKAIEVRWCNYNAAYSAIHIQKQQIDLGNEGFQVLISDRNMHLFGNAS